MRGADYAFARWCDQPRQLASAGEPLSRKAIVERAFAAGYWQSDGKTPHAPVYSAILREMHKEGEDALFEPPLALA